MNARTNAHIEKSRQEGHTDTDTDTDTDLLEVVNSRGELGVCLLGVHTRNLQLFGQGVGVLAHGLELLEETEDSGGTEQFLDSDGISRQD